MEIIFYILAGIIVLWAGYSIIRAVKNRGNCCGGCDNCRQCNHCNRADKPK